MEEFDTIDFSSLSDSTPHEIQALALSEQEETIKIRLFELALEKSPVGSHVFATTNLYLGSFLKLEQLLQESMEWFLKSSDFHWAFFARLQLLCVLGEKRETLNFEFYNEDKVVDGDKFVTSYEKDLFSHILESVPPVPQDLLVKVTSVIMKIATSNTSSKSLESQRNAHKLLLLAYKLLENSTFPHNFARVCMHLGESFARQNMPEKALEFFYSCADSLGGSSSILDLEMKGQACINASCLEADEDKAVDMFEEGIHVFKRALEADPANTRLKEQLEILSQ